MITFKALRNLVSTTKGKALPTARALRESGSPVIISTEVAGGALTVYESGFYTYSTPVGTTVYAVDRCSDYGYDGGDALPQELFDEESRATIFHTAPIQLNAATCATRMTLLLIWKTVIWSNG